MDALTTAIGLQLGLAESVPLSKDILGVYGLIGLIEFKGTIAFLCLGIALFFRNKTMSPIHGYALLVASGAVFMVFALPVANNITVILEKIL